MEELPAYAADWRGGGEKARKSVRRKFERDKDELRSLGIPIETVPYTVGALAEEMEGYRIRRRDFYLPYLKLLEEEREDEEGRGKAVADAVKEGKKPYPGGPASHADTLEIPREAASSAVQGLRNLADLPAFPLAGAARSALRKITFDLDPEAFGDAPVLFAVPEETARAREHLERLSDALMRRKVVTFTYHGIHRGRDTRRRVRPFGLLFQHAHWYLVGWDEDREAERLFRVDRMEGVEVNGKRPHTPDYELPDEPVLERYRDREAWELGEADDTVTARARFRFPTSLWAERNGYGVEVATAGDGSAVREFEVRQPHAFLRWILSLAGDATVESPRELREGLETMRREVAALYGEDARA